MDVATDLALLLAGFIDEAEASRRLDLDAGELGPLLDAFGLSGTAMMPVGVNDKLEVLYRDMGRESFDRPLFDDVVDNLSRSARQDLRFSLGAGAILDTCSDKPPEAPAGLIFHVGRCGSNLLCNLLAQIPAVAVLREPEFLNALFLNLGAEQDRERRARLQALIPKLLRGLARGVRQDALGRPRRCVVKFSSWNGLFGEDLMRRLPHTASVMVVRAPWETVSSYLQAPPYWYAYSPDEKGVAGAVRYFAGNWSAIMGCALRLPAARNLIVRYDELTADPRAALEKVCRLFGIDRTAVDGPAIGRVMQAYSKSAGLEPFDPDGRHRRQALAPDLHDLVTEITASSWAALQERTAAAPVLRA